MSSDDRPKQYVAEGTTGVSVHRHAITFADFLAAGDDLTRAELREKFGERRLVVELQGRVITFERREQLSPSSVRYVKTSEPRAERVHVQTVYALGWP